jgi:hypothetical protein
MSTAFEERPGGLEGEKGQGQKKELRLRSTAFEERPFGS